MAARKKKIQSESMLLAHARKELELLGEDEDTIEGYLKVVQAFSEMNHSGGSASIAIPVLNSLFLFKHITPLTNDPAEWMKIDKDMWDSRNDVWQSKRNPEAFSTDGGKTYYLLSEGAHSLNQRPLHSTLVKEA